MNYPGNGVFFFSRVEFDRRHTHTHTRGEGRLKDFLQRATHTKHIHTDARTHTAGASEGT